MFFWYIGVYLNICAVASYNKELTIGAIIKSVIFPYIGFYILIGSDYVHFQTILWRSE